MRNLYIYRCKTSSLRKAPKLVLMAFFFMLGMMEVFAQAVTVTSTTGLPNPSAYTTLKAAFDNINAGLHRGEIVININQSTTETASAVLNASGTSFASYSSVLIRPTAPDLSISGDLSTGLIILNGADRVTIDGRVNGIGNEVSLKLINLNTGNNAGITRFIGGAEKNTIRYCEIQSANQAGNIGALEFSTSVANTNGNSDNTIEFNRITGSSGGRPACVISSNGTVGIPNVRIKIRNNLINDVFLSNNSNQLILISNHSRDVEIVGNSWYETSDVNITAGTVKYIVFITGTVNNINVKNNYFGGKAPECGGDVLNLTASSNTNFAAIYSVGATSENRLISVQGNQINKLTFASPYSSSTIMQFAGISLNGSTFDNLQIGNEQGNIIGSSTAANGIEVTTSNASSNVFVSGIHLSGFGKAIVNNNTIAGFQASNTNGGTLTFSGISSTSSIGELIISNNTIGSETVAKSFAIKTNTENLVEQISGIRVAGNAATVVEGNIISNLHNGNTSTQTSANTRGILSTGNNTDIINNTILNVTADNLSQGNVASISLMGISAGTVRTIKGNKISGLRLLATTAQIKIVGIFAAGGIAGTISENFLSDITLNSTNDAASIEGIYVGTTVGIKVINNVVILGKNHLFNCRFRGIIDYSNVTAANNAYYYNTVVIEGEGTGSEAVSNLRFWNPTPEGRVVIGNIFVNSRTNVAAGPTIHYNFEAFGTFTSNYNNFVVNGPTVYTGRLAGTPAITLTNWRDVTGQDANGISINPQFVNANGTSAQDFRVNAVMNGLFEAGGVTKDFNGLTRSNPPTIGAFERNTCSVTSGVLTQQACNSITINSQTYTESGVYTQILTNAAGCDSILTLQLTILQPTAAYIEVSGCGQVQVNSQTYTTSGLFTQNFTNAVGCDSTLTINVIINPCNVEVNATAIATEPVFYNTVAAAFSAINAGIHRGGIQVKLLNSTIETAAITVPVSGVGSALFDSVLVFPTQPDLSITSTLNAAIFTLNNARNVIFDGRVNATGATPSLLVQNSNTGVNAEVFRLTNGANNNAFRFLRVECSNTAAGRATLNLISARHNKIENNIFSKVSNAATGPRSSINIDGTAILRADSNLIRNNHFENTLAAANDNFCIVISSNAVGTELSGNSFYETQAITRTANGFLIYISLNATGIRGTKILNNYFGGSAPMALGNKTVINANTVDFTYSAMDVQSGTIDEPTSVQGNIIRNISLATNSSSNLSYFRGIRVLNGNTHVNVGNIEANFIGSDTDVESIILNPGSAAQFASGINIESAANALIENNQISGIRIANDFVSPKNFYAINLTAIAGNFSLLNNTIGSETLANSISIAANANTFSDLLAGIRITGAAGVNIQGNTISNLRNNATASAIKRTVGILSQNSNVSIVNNEIYNISSTATSTATGANASLIGIQTDGAISIAGNTVYNLNAEVASSNTSVYGIFNQSVAANISRNIVRDITNNSSSASAVINGIRLASNVNNVVFNNIIALGRNQSSNVVIEGINDQNTFVTGVKNYYFNTILIAGQGTGNGNSSALTFASSIPNSRQVINNLLVNTRTNTSGTAKHYMVNIPAKGNSVFDYNNYFSGTAGQILATESAIDYTTLNDWRTAINDEANGISVNPIFDNVSGNAPEDFKVSAFMPGLNNAGNITVDFAGDPRNDPPTMGVWEGGACAPTSASITETACDAFTINGETFTQSGIFTQTLANALGCDSILTINLTINLSPVAQEVTIVNESICANTSTTVSLTNSEAGVRYTLRNDADNSVIGGSVIGSGSSISFNTGAISQNTTFNVLGEIPNVEALDFRGNSFTDYVDLGTGLNSVFAGTNKITVEAWVKRNTTGTLQTIVSNYQGSMQYLLRIDNDRIAFWVSDGSFGVANGSTSLPVNTWIHLAGTWDGTTIRVYYNGVLDGSSNKSGNFQSSSNILKIGGGLTNNTEYFPGSISDVRIWNVTRSQSEIANNRTACLEGNETGLKALYRMTDGTNSTTLTDLTGNGYNGNLVNMNASNAWVSGPPLFDCSIDCPSLMQNTVSVTINNPTSETINLTACDSLTLNGETYYDSGIYIQNLINQAGCDSVLTINLTINNSSNRLPAGINWQIQQSAADNLWNAVTYGNGLFVAVSSSGTGNRVMTSPDGITWTSRVSAANNPWNSIVYANGQFVAVGQSVSNNGVMTSPDGITWTLRTGASNFNWVSVTYGNGLFVAVSTSGLGSNRVMTSPDGINWTLRSGTGAFQWRSVTYGNGLFVAVAVSGTGNRVMTSPDGINWTERTSAADYTWVSVTYGNGLFAAVAQNGTGNRVMTSPDGINWTLRNTPSDHLWTSVSYGNGLFVAVSSSGTDSRVMSSPDGINWTLRNSAADNNWSGISYGAGKFVAVATSGVGNRVMTSNFGTNAIFDTQTACDQFIWIDGNTYTANNNTATFTLINAAGCDSTVTLNLTIKNSTSASITQAACNSFTLNGQTYTSSGQYIQTLTNAVGCDSTLTINLTINNSTSASITETACDSFTINGETFTQTGIFTQSFTNAAGCDSTLTIDLTINNSNSATITETACDSFTINGETFTTTGQYTQNLTNNAGCDSTLTINLTINNSTAASISETACDAFTINGETFTQSGIFTQTFTNAVGCDSTLTINLTINNSTSASITETACDSFTINGETFTQTGIFTQSFTNAAGCDSTLTIDLTINNSNSASITETACDSFTINGETFTQSGVFTQSFTNAAGCDSTLTINLTINNSTSASITETACDAFTINGETFTQTGLFTQTFTNAVGCDSTLTINLTINNSTSASITETACDSFTINGETFTQTGIFTQSFTNAAGCDSTLTIDLTINNSNSATITETACDSFTINGETFTQSGVFTQSFTNAAGCDSTLTINLTINNSSTSSITETACDAFTINGETFTQSGVFTQTFTNAVGCDSTLTINLTINNSTSASITETACDSFTINGETFTQTGIFTQSFTNAAGCDSTLTIDLTINNSNSATITESACDSFTINGETFTQSGVFTQSFTNAAGCDSTLTINLTINNSTASSITETACDAFTINGETFTHTGLFTQTLTNTVGCDSTLTINLTINNSTTETIDAEACSQFTLNGQTYTQSGTYTQTLVNAAGCDSTITLNLQIDGIVLTESITETACESFTINGETFTQTGIFTQNFTSVEGCDSVLTINLTINNATSETLIQDACDSFTINNETFTESGTYTQLLINTAGCDSTLTINLTINNSTTSSIIETACDAFTINGETFTQTGIFTQTFTNAVGCDSTLTINLTINNSTSASITETACDSFTINGETFTESGVYMQLFTNAAGCDSTLTIDLTINNSNTASITETACDAFTINGETFTQSGVFTQTLINNAGCDSTLTINLTINNSSSSSLTETACESFELNGEVYTTSGVYVQTFINAVGCDSTLTLDLTINQPSGIILDETACESFTLNGITYTENGTYFQQFTNAVGCDSVIVINLTLLDSPPIENITETACDVFTLNGESFTQSGVYTQIVPASNGVCDSTIVLNLTINNSVATSFTIETSGSYEWNGIVYTESGTYTQVLQTIAGCDSTVTLNLILCTPTTETQTVTACDGFSPFPGLIFTQSGNYSLTYTNVGGCDSTIVIALTINQSSSSSIIETACNSFTLNGTTYNSTGVYTQVLTNAAGCDSTLTLNLTILNSTAATITPVVCGSFELNGEVYTQSGIYTQSFTNAVGCDSTLTINLTVNQSQTASIEVSGCGSVTVNGEVFKQSGTFVQNLTTTAGCDSTLTINVTVNNQSSGFITTTSCGSFELNNEVYTTSGTYTQTLTNAAGCDSILTLNLTIITVDAGVTAEGATLTATQTGATYQWINCDTNEPIAAATAQSFTATSNGNYAVVVTIGDCSATSECVNVTGLSVTNFNVILNVYPNPSRGLFTLELSHRKRVPYQLYNAIGQLIEQGEINDIRKDFDLSSKANGVYLLRVEHEVFRLIKQ